MCAVLYMVLKVALVWEKGQLLVVSAKALTQAHASYGKAVSPAELCEIGGTCSICQARIAGCTPEADAAFALLGTNTYAARCRFWCCVKGQWACSQQCMCRCTAGGLHAAAEAVVQPRFL